MVTLAQRREAIAHLETAHEMSERRACRIIGVDRTSVRYQRTKPDDAELGARIIAMTKCVPVFDCVTRTMSPARCWRPIWTVSPRR